VSDISALLARALRTANAGASGAIGGVVGALPDLGVNVANLGRAAYGYGGHQLGLLNASQMPEPIDASSVPLTSEWISKRMGVGDSPEEQIAQFAGGFLSPGGKKAPQKMDWTAYHGSPHKFEKFSLDKIGTGEGAQAYGHGLYFADDPAVAANYFRRLGGDYAPIIELNVGGRRVGERNNFDYSPRRMGNPFLDDVDNLRSSLIEDLLINEADLRGAVANGGVQSYALKQMDAKLADLANYPRENAGIIKAAQHLRQSLERPGAVDLKLGEIPGGIYKVDIDDVRAPKDAFLLLDSPLKDQPKAVKDAARDRLKSMGYLKERDNGPRQLSAAWREAMMAHGRPWSGGGDGSRVYDLFSKNAPFGGDSQAWATQELRARGIPGLRYYDGGSRDAKRGTMNTVLFDDDLVKILSRNGEPLP